MTREALLAEAAERYRLTDNRWRAHETDEQMKRRYYMSGASWEAQRSAVLLEALESVGRFADSTFAWAGVQEIVRAALEKYRGKQ